MLSPHLQSLVDPLDPGYAANIYNTVMRHPGVKFTAQEMLVFFKLDSLNSARTMSKSLSEGNFSTISHVEFDVVEEIFIGKKDHLDLF